MKQAKLKVLSNIKLTDCVYELKLVGDVGEAKAGQFIEIALSGFCLRRPFGVCDIADDTLTILYRVQGQGTEAMTKLCEGEVLDCLTGLGNGFDTEKSQKPLVIGGGMGIAPLYLLVKTLIAEGKEPTVVLGYKTKHDAFYIKEFEKLARVIVATDDGSQGITGNVLHAVQKSGIVYDYYYACGPMIMLKSLAEYSPNGEISLEARMGCGFGACMGCSIQTKEGAKRVCKEGPVFSSAEVIF